MESIYVSTYRERARELLAGHWGIGILVWFIPTLLAGLTVGILSGVIIVTVPISILIIRLVGSLFTQLINYGVQGAYYHWYQGQENATAMTGFNLGMANFWPLLKLVFFESLFIFLWSLLLVIPGLVKAFSYSQAIYLYFDKVQAGEPPAEISALACITESRQLMDGRKADLFGLEFSFIGWALLSLITLGIGFLWLEAYVQVAQSAFHAQLISDPNMPTLVNN